ncbi:MAG: TolC family protein [Bacteroides sp.]|nr:TolC family protein [Bacteroides sp.]
MKKLFRYSPLLLLLTISSSLVAQKSWTLRECIDYAIANNIQIKQREITAAQYKNEVHTTKYSRLPNLSSSVNQNFNFGRSASPIDNTYTNVNSRSSSFSLNTNVPIFTGLELPNQYELAKLNLQAAIEDLNKAKEDISMTIISYFLQVLFNEELTRVAQEQVILSKEQLVRAESLLEVGKASVAEVAESRTRLVQDELSFIQAKNNYELSLLDLSQLLELPTPEGFRITDPNEIEQFYNLQMPETVYTEALMIRPEIKAVRYRLEGAGKSIRIAQSNYYPSLYFSAGLGTSYNWASGREIDNFDKQWGNNFNKAFGFSLSIPIFNRFSTQNCVKNARLQEMSYGWQLEETKKDLYKEIQQAYYNASAAYSKFTTSVVAVEATQASFELMNEKFEQGKATSVEYNESKLNLMRSQSELLQAKYEYLFRTRILHFYAGEEIR